MACLFSLPLLITAFASIAAATADGPALDIKTGLWEMTRTTAINGAPTIPAEVLAQMRALLTAALVLAC